MRKYAVISMLSFCIALSFFFHACDNDSSPTCPEKNDDPVIVIEGCNLDDLYVLDTVDDRSVTYWLERDWLILPLLIELHSDSLGVYSGRVFHQNIDWGWLDIDSDSGRTYTSFELKVPESLNPFEYARFHSLKISDYALSGTFVYCGATMDCPAPDFTAYKLTKP